MKTYEDAVKLLTSPKKFKIDLGLERIEKILELLGNPQDKLKCIHVAGTNGKGSVCAIIATILSKAGIKTGLYTSPHIFDYTERIKILAAKQLGSQAAKLDNSENSQEQLIDKNLSTLRPFNHSTNVPPSPQPSPSRGEGACHDSLSTLQPFNPSTISHSDFAEYVFEICDLAEQNGINLTEFEILTAVMFKYFADNNVEVVVLETGLGGRFDATNVIKSNLCAIITHIDLDHTERLGNTKSQIAFEKAGIIKPNCPVFTCEGYEEIKDKADECNSLFSLVTPTEDTTNLSLKGSCQQENLSLALAAVRYLFPQIPENLIQEALKEVKHPCRFQKVGNIIIDASHNPNGAMALRESLDMYSNCWASMPNLPANVFPSPQPSPSRGEGACNDSLSTIQPFNPSTKMPPHPNPLPPGEGVSNDYPPTSQPYKCFVFGCLRTKDYPKMMKILFSEGDEIYFYHFKHPNSCTIEELKKVCKFPSKEFKSLDEMPKDKLIIICGSFYMLNEIIPRELVLL